MIRVVIEMEIRTPYNKSFGTIVEFCSVWDSVVLSGGMNKKYAKISLPLKYFKKIMGANPKVGKYKVPNGMEKFIKTFEVKETIAK